MKGNHNNPDFMLEKAIASLRNDEPDAKAIETATTNAWRRITEQVGTEMTVRGLNRIEGCADVRQLLSDFDAHRLAPARAMLVADHLRECAACRVHANVDKSTDSILPWRANTVARPRQWSFGQYALAASVLIAAILGVAIGRSGILAPSGYRAALESVDGVLYRVDANGEHRAKVGEQLGEGEIVRTASGSRAVLRLRDGSSVEMNGRSELFVSIGLRDTTLHLGRGIVIVQAAKRKSGHLYVKTSDARVAVTGTIFSVNSGIKGSRVSVIEGTVQVAQAGSDSVLHAGDQVVTNVSMGEVPVRDEIAWSQNLDKYLALLAEFSKFERNVQQIALPDLRYQSALLNVVPNGTVVYAGVPNLGEALSQANQLFQQQLAQSQILNEWWQQGPGRVRNGADFNEAINTIHSLSQYLGKEIVFSASGGPARHGSVVAMAEIAAPGLREFLGSQIEQKQAQHVQILAPEDLGTVTPTSNGLYILVTPEFVAASPDVAVLAEVNSRWQQRSNASGFASSDFGQRIASEYSSGAGVLVAVNLGEIAARQVEASENQSHSQFLASSGFANVKYLIAQRKDSGGKTSNTAELSFNGPRTGMASWLAAPAPIGALRFVTPNAAAVGAFVSKSPALMVDDLLQIVTSADPNGAQSWTKHQAELNLDIRNDLAASLGGEAAVALDGPLLPTPSWKLIVEVYDPTRLEFSLEKLVEAMNRDAAAHNRLGVTIEQQQVSDRAYYTVRSLDPAVQLEVHYTFSDGYLIAGPSQALVQEALLARDKGDSISDSSTFRALFPADQHVNVSGLIYQNLAPVVGPIAGQLSATQLQSIQTLVSNSEPSIICAYGGDNEIELSSNSKTLGLNLKALTISALLDQLKSGTRQTATP